MPVGFKEMTSAERPGLLKDPSWIDLASRLTARGWPWHVWGIFGGGYARLLGSHKTREDAERAAGLWRAHTARHGEVSIVTVERQP